MKRFVGFMLCLVLALGSIGALGGCGAKKELVIWTFTDEIQKVVGNYYLKDIAGKTFGVKNQVYKAADTGLDYDIKVVIIPSEVYQNKLDPVLKSGKDAPDVFALEAQYMLKYLSSGTMMSMGDDGLGLQTAANEKLAEYANVVATDADGKLRALCMQATPGAYYYRRGIANEMGLDTAEKVQAKISTFDNFMAFAAELKAKNDYRILSALSDISMPLLSARENGWIVKTADGKEQLNVDKIMLNTTTDGKKDYYDYTRDLQIGNGKPANNDPPPMFINESTPWSEGWFADMAGSKVFGYFLPTWGLSYLLMNNAADTAGDWGVVEGPQTFFNGGTWITARNGTKMKEEAKQFIEYYALNDSFAKAWAVDTGDFVGNKAVANEIKTQMGTTSAAEFLGGQNHYELFNKLVDKVDASTLSPYDMAINSLFDGTIITYSTDLTVTKKAAAKEFVDNFKSSFPSIIVPQSLLDYIA